MPCDVASGDLQVAESTKFPRIKM